MFDWFISLSTENKIEIISMLATSITSIISIFIAVATLKQTNKIQKESNRPYIAVSLNYIHISKRNKYIIVKNYGNTAGIIKSISFSKKLGFEIDRFNEPFANIANTVLAPNQAITTYAEFEPNSKPIEVTITYTSFCETFTEKYTLNPAFSSDLVSKKHTVNSYSNTENLILNTTEEFIRSQY